jgi:predicted ATPase
LISFITSVTWAAFTEYLYLRHLWKLCIRKYNAEGLYHSRHELTAKIYDRRNRMDNRRALEKAKAHEKAKRDGGQLEPQRSGQAGRVGLAAVV